MRLFTSKESEPKDENGEKKIESIKDNGDIEAVPAAQVADEIDPVVEKRVRRKLDTHIVPLLSALYLLAFLDRSNIGSEKAKFLTEKEKAVARARGVAQAGAATRIGGIDWKEILEGLMDVKGWILGVSLWT
ncbi:unnamed protein product [Alternaria alternata]